MKHAALLFPTLLTAVLGACPDLWVAVGTSCYRISSDRFNWYEAQSYCESEGGYLIEILDENEQASLIQFTSPSDQLYWIGLTDLANEGDFTWDASGTGLGYTHWESGQPNNRDGVEDCVHTYPDLYWNDADCSFDYDPTYGLNLHALCEKPNA